VPQFTKRELFSAMARGRFRKVGELDPALEVLDSHGHIRLEPEPPRAGPGRPRSPAYLVHPMHHSAESAQSAEP
jgi:replicative DNA helicase